MQTLMSNQYWTNRMGHPDEVDAMLRLVRAVHEDRHPELDRSYWRWRYLSDSRHRGEVVVAQHEGEIIGIQPVSLFDYRWNDARLTGATYTGVMTHPAHRPRGVFRSLVESANAWATDRRAHFSVTMPNDASLPGFRQSDGWSYAGPIPLYVKVADGAAAIRTGVGATAAGLLGWLPQAIFRRSDTGGPSPALDMEMVDRVPDELDDLAEPFARECASLGIVRSSAYWNWRYSSKPGAKYRTLFARRAGQLVGAVVISVERRFKMEVGMILDIVTSGGSPVIRELLYAAEQDFVSRDLGLITCQATSPLLQRALGDEGYLRPPARLLPKRFHFVCRPTGVRGLPGNPDSVSDWHLTFGDSDNT